MDSSPGHAVGTTRDAPGRPAGPPPAPADRRRPALPRHLESTGVGWMIAAVGLITLSLLLFTAGRYGRGISSGDRQPGGGGLANLRTPG